jgi:hypothetical protein
MVAGPLLPTEQMDPKQRTLLLDAHVVAWLGNYISYVKATVRRKAEEQIKIQNTSASLPAVPKCTASSRNQS